MPSTRKSRFRRYWPAGLLLLAGLAGSGLLGWNFHRQATALDQQRFALRIKDSIDQLDGRVEKTEALLCQLRDYLMLSGETRNRIFGQWCSANNLSVNCPWVYGIAVATNRSEAPWRPELPRSPDTWKAQDWARFRQVAATHPIQCEIMLRSPAGKRKFLDDYDLKGLLSDSNVFVSAARKPGVKISGMRSVMLDETGSELKGAIMLAAVQDAAVIDLLQQISRSRRERAEPARWVHLDSMILAPIDFKMLEAALWQKGRRDLGIEIFASREPSRESWVNPQGDRPRALDPNFKPYLKATVLWPMYGGRWSLFIYSLPLFEAQSSRKLGWLVFGSGTGMTALATALLSLALRARSRQEQLAEQIREARDSLAAAQKERQKLSHNLHDNTIQALYAIQLGLSRTGRQLREEPGGAELALASVRKELDVVIAQIRRFITSEHATEELVDLAAVLRSLASRARPDPGARVEVHCDPDASGRLSASQAVQLANIAREALSNSLRHARPLRVELALRSEPGAVCLEVVDDGAGFDPQSRPQGLGITSMATRGREAGGTVEIHSVPGQGTRVRIRVPASPLDHAEAPFSALERD
jgi:signal transduction histidine kinase